MQRRYRVLGRYEFGCQPIKSLTECLRPWHCSCLLAQTVQLYSTITAANPRQDLNSVQTVCHQQLGANPGQAADLFLC